MRCWSLTFSLELANQSCQMKVMRSTNCWSERTMRSSHQQWSWPHSSAGASALPSSSVGSGPVRTAAPVGRVRPWITASIGCPARLSACPGVGPKPARLGKRYGRAEGRNGRAGRRRWVERDRWWRGSAGQPGDVLVVLCVLAVALVLLLATLESLARLLVMRAGLGVLLMPGLGLGFGLGFAFAAGGFELVLVGRAGRDGRGGGPARAGVRSHSE